MTLTIILNNPVFCAIIALLFSILEKKIFSRRNNSDLSFSTQENRA